MEKVLLKSACASKETWHTQKIRKVVWIYCDVRCSIGYTVSSQNILFPRLFSFTFQCFLIFLPVSLYELPVCTSSLSMRSKGTILECAGWQVLPLSQRTAFAPLQASFIKCTSAEVPARTSQNTTPFKTMASRSQWLKPCAALPRTTRALLLKHRPWPVLRP